jgi:hypothetical protein
MMRGIYFMHAMGISWELSFGSKNLFLQLGHSKHFPNSVFAMVASSLSQFGQTTIVTIFSIRIHAPLN